MAGLDFDDLMNHKGNESGGGSFLKNWKKDGQIVVWLHPKAMYYPQWSHSWYRFDTKDEKNPLTSVKFASVNCMENEDVLQKQYKRRDSGERVEPPHDCPMCRMTEWVYQQILMEQLSFAEPIFRFEDDENEVIIHSGGICGQFQKRDLSSDEKRAMKKARVRESEAYRENALARLSYIFTVIPDQSPEEGAMIARETVALKKALTTAVSNKIEDLGRQKGHPAMSPYPFKWKYDESEQFSKRYSAVALTREPSDELLKVFSEDPPDVSDILKPPDFDELYNSMKKASLIKMPFDEFFDSPRISATVQVPQDDEKPPSNTSDGEPEVFECDNCGEDFEELTEADECPKCGCHYSQDDGDDFVVSTLKCRHCSHVDDVTEFKGGVCPKCGAKHGKKWVLKEAPKSEQEEEDPSKKAKRKPRQPRRRASA